MDETETTAEDWINAAEVERVEERRQAIAEARRLLEPDERRDLLAQVEYWRSAYGAAMSAFAGAIGGETDPAYRLAEEVLRIRWGAWYDVGNCPHCIRRKAEAGNGR